jgi:hypothetical protein
MNYAELRQLQNLDCGLVCPVHVPDPRENAAQCHICLRRGGNTREHVPPQAAFNKERRTWDRLHVRGNDARIVRTPIAAGHYVRTLCNQCNTVRCKPYAEEYSRFVQSLREKPAILAADGLYWISVQNKLSLAKQIATMILASEPIVFARRERALRQFVLDPLRVFQPRFRVLAFLVVKDEAAGTVTRWHGRADLFSRGYDFAGGEISSYPFGFVYTVKIGSSYKPRELTDITSWFMGGTPEPERFGVHWTGVGSISDAVGHKRRRAQVDWVTG